LITLALDRGLELEHPESEITRKHSTATVVARVLVEKRAAEEFLIMVTVYHL
jgi:hypothetical protein